MKILFFGWDSSISPASRTVDYMGDCVYHGLKSVLGKDVHTVQDQFHMYKDLPPEYAGYFHGKGFTLCGNLDPSIKSVYTPEEILENIKTKFYDCVIFSRIYRTTQYYKEVSKYYKDNEIVIIDGHDITELQEDYRKHLYFKRELIEEPTEMLHPISFSIPKEKLCGDKEVCKTRDLAKAIPGDMSTFTYSSEEEYYKGYQESFFGITHKKGGWDCMRHLEIMANKCLPFFEGIDDCPPHTMAEYPKQILSRVADHIKRKTMTKELRTLYTEEMYDHVAKNQTTEAQALRIIKIIKKICLTQ